MTSEREHELEQDLAQFDWHPLDERRPADRQMVIATDGVARWMDMYFSRLDRLSWQGHVATHWHAVREIPDSIKPKSKTAPVKKFDPDDEVRF
jgi:hypothetical protein